MVQRQLSALGIDCLVVAPSLDQEHEALRNLVRARAAAKSDQLRAKHRLSKFLLCQGCQPPVGARNWSKRHFVWLRQLEFEHTADQIVFADYLAEVTAAAVARALSTPVRTHRAAQGHHGGGA